MKKTVFDWKLPQRLKLTPVDGGYEINGSIAFVIGCDGRQTRYVLQDRHFLCKGCHRKALAKAAREAVRSKRSGSGYAAQEAYVGALRDQDLRPNAWDLIKLWVFRILS